MWRVSRRAGGALCAASTTLLPLAAHADHTGSKARLAEYMARIGYPQHSADYVVLKDGASAADCAEYLQGDILGHRVAFRLKGLAFGDKFISGLGKVSVMEGEIVNKEFVASLPLFPTGEGDRGRSVEAAAVRCPTRLRECRQDLTKPFMGKLPEGGDLPALDVHYSPVDKEHEVLLGGVCCSDDCWGESSGCDDDKIAQKLQSLSVPTDPTMSIVPPQYTTPPNDSTACVVCRWLEAGPCAAEYNAWDAAMGEFTTDGENEQKRNAFFASAQVMSTCVRAHEYYDVYVAFL